MNSFRPSSHPLDYPVFDLSLWERYSPYHFITCTTRYTCRSRIKFLVPLSEIVSISFLVDGILDWIFYFYFILYLFLSCLFFIFPFILFYFFFSLFILISFCFILFYSYFHLFLCFILQFMWRSQSTGDLLFNPKIKRSLRQLRRAWRVVKEVPEVTMANENEHDDRAMKDYLAPTLEGCSPSIMRQPVQVNNFELKTSLIQFVQQNY